MVRRKCILWLMSKYLVNTERRLRKNSNVYLQSNNVNRKKYLLDGCFLASFMYFFLLFASVCMYVDGYWGSLLEWVDLFGLPSLHSFLSPLSK